MIKRGEYRRGGRRYPEKGVKRQARNPGQGTIEEPRGGEAIAPILKVRTAKASFNREFVHPKQRFSIAGRFFIQNKDFPLQADNPTASHHFSSQPMNISCAKQHFYRNAMNTAARGQTRSRTPLRRAMRISIKTMYK